MIGPVCSERNTVIGIGISGDGLHTLELCTPVVYHRKGTERAMDD
jgi:hypothetical protein